MWFDRELQPGTSFAKNWKAFVTPNAITLRFKPVGPLTVSGNTVSGPMEFDIFAGNDTSVRYLALTPDVRGLRSHLLVQPFANFPLRT